MNAIIIGNNGKSSIVETLNKMNSSVRLFQKKENGLCFEYDKLLLRWKNIKSLPSFTKDDLIIKWGNSIATNGGTIVNTSIASSNASNKGLFRRLMYEASVPIPGYIESSNLRIYDNQWPVITRPNKHHAGKNFFVAYSKKELEQNIRFAGGLQNSYTSGFYPKGREVRVHCAFGKVLLIKEKPAPEDKNTIAWNFALNEEAWSTIDRKDYDPEVCKLALMSMNTIKLDIGAVDIMFDPIKPGYPQYVVCEINSAPSLTPYLAEKYAMLFDKIFTSGIPEYWDYAKFKKGDSFAWKNFQLQQ